MFNIIALIIHTLFFAGSVYKHSLVNIIFNGIFMCFHSLIICSKIYSRNDNEEEVSREKV